MARIYTTDVICTINNQVLRERIFARHPESLISVLAAGFIVPCWWVTLAPSAQKVWSETTCPVLLSKKRRQAGKWRH